MKDDNKVDLTVLIEVKVPCMPVAGCDEEHKANVASLLATEQSIDSISVGEVQIVEAKVSAIHLNIDEPSELAAHANAAHPLY